MKRKVTAIVEKASDGYYACYVDNELDGYGIAGYGETAEQAMSDMQTAYREISEIRESEGQPAEELEFVYKYDMVSFFNYFSFLNISKVGEIAGINSSLLRQYATGKSKPGKKQFDKLRAAVKQISREMAVAVF